MDRMTSHNSNIESLKAELFAAGYAALMACLILSSCGGSDGQDGKDAAVTVMPAPVTVVVDDPDSVPDNGEEDGKKGRGPKPQHAR